MSYVFAMNLFRFDLKAYSMSRRDKLQILQPSKIRQSKMNSRSVAGPMGQMNPRPSV